MKKLINSILASAFMLISSAVRAQSEVEMADGMRAEGKIYVVIAIILIVLTGFIVYLVLLDRKVKKLEKLLENRNSAAK